MRPELQGLEYDPPTDFRALYQSNFGGAIWVFLRSSDNVVRIETATFLERPAVEPLAPGLLQEFEKHFSRCSSEDLKITKRMIGHMVKHIMEMIGYEVDRAQGDNGNVPVKANPLFSSGSRYKRKP